MIPRCYLLVLNFSRHEQKHNNVFCKKNYLSLQFFVKNVNSKTSGTSTFHFGKQISDLLLALNLFNQVSAFDKVTKLSITMGISNLMEFQKRLVNSLFQFQLALNSVFSRIPFLGNGFLNILENNTASTHVLVVDQFLSMFTFPSRFISKTLGKSLEGNIITIKITGHSHVDIAGIELHVDLLVEHSLGVGVKVNSDFGSHFFSWII